VKLPAGFTAAGVAAGLKPSGKPDLGLLLSDRPASAAGVFTTNRVRAAPVIACEQQLARGTARAIVVNAGNANACTGARGVEDARAMIAATADALGVDLAEVLVASTGIIGVPMDMDKVRAGIGAAAGSLSPAGAMDLASAICTTDTTVKTARASWNGSSIVGVAKGAGMIAPEMATMLAFVATDAAVDPVVLQEVLRAVTPDSFGSISVDGCMSTNDTVLLLANGASGSDPVTTPDQGFTAALGAVCASLARQIVADGEGATKVVTIEVIGAADRAEARSLAGRVADSVLLRCAIHGADPNWGRVLAALGTAGVAFDPDVVDVWLGGEKLCDGGAIGPGDREVARAHMQGAEVDIRVDMHRGSAGARMLTNDLSAEYVRINSEYTT